MKKIIFYFIIVFLILSMLSFSSSLLKEEEKPDNVTEEDVTDPIDSSDVPSRPEYVVSFVQNEVILYSVLVEEGDSFYVPEIYVEAPAGGDYLFDSWVGDGYTYKEGQSYPAPKKSVVLTPVFVLNDSSGGDTESDTETDTEVHVHSLSYSVISKATCIRVGSKIGTCSCGFSQTETIPINSDNHVNPIFEYVNEVNHTVSCDACGAFYYEAHYVPSGASDCAFCDKIMG